MSVALCTFNGERFLEAQLRSILAQDRPPDEIVIGDDGSTDRTLRIIDAVLGSAAIPYRVLAPGATRGVTENFDRTIGECEGDVVVLSDQDDVWDARRIARAVEVFDLWPDIELVHSDALLIDEQGAPTGSRLIETLAPTAAERLALRDGDLFGTLLRRNLATGATISFRRSLLDLARPLPSSWLHDEWLAIVAASRGSARFIDETWIAYRIHDANQVGARQLSLAQRVEKVFAPRNGRSARLAARAAILNHRLTDAGAASEYVDAAASKYRFEARRADLPPSRLKRVPEIGRLWRSGDYARYASRGNTDVLRDLLQSP